MNRKPEKLHSTAHSSFGNRTLLFAAGMGWIGIAIHLYNWLDVDVVGFALPTTKVVFGVTLLEIASGIANIRWFARSGTLSIQWLLINVQIFSGLVALYLSQVYTPAMMLIIAMAQVPARSGIAFISSFFVLSNIALGLVFLQITPSISQALVELFIFIGFQLFALTIAITQQREKLANEALAAANKELVATRGLLAESARSEERLRVSRELHDIAGHSLTAMAIRLEAHCRKAPDYLKPGLLATRDLTRELLSDIRAVVSHLRQHDIDSLRDELGRISNRFPNVRIHLNTADICLNQFAQLEILVRCIQEATTNAVRHGSAGNIWISFDEGGSEIAVVARDDGAGGIDFDRGNGLRGMEERLLGLGGRLDIIPSIEDGWTIKMYFPKGNTSTSRAAS